MLTTATAIMISIVIGSATYPTDSGFTPWNGHGYDTIFELTDHTLKVQYLSNGDYMYPQLSGHPNPIAQKRLNTDWRNFVVSHYDDWQNIDWEAEEQLRADAAEYSEPYFPPQQTIATITIDFVDKRFMMVTRNAEDEYDLSMCDNVEYESYSSQTLEYVDLCKELFVKSAEAQEFVTALLDEKIPIVNDEDDMSGGFDSAADMFYMTAEGLVGARIITTWYTCDGGVDCDEKNLAFDMEELFERFGKRL